MKFFMGKLLWCLMFKTLKQYPLYKACIMQLNIRGKFFVVLLKTVKNAKV